MKKNALKRTLAGVLAILCVAGALPANVDGGGLFDTAIVASAEGDEVAISGLWIGDSGEIKSEGVVNGTNGSGTATVSTEGESVVLELNNFSYNGTGPSDFPFTVSIYYKNLST